MNAASLATQTTENIADQIQHELLSWDGVTVEPHRFGGLEFRVGNREFGHLHGNYQADIPFSANLRKELVTAGKASLHHLYPNSGWISFYISSVEDVPALIELFRLNYARLARGRVAALKEPGDRDID
jgi:Family of unknown function (DUF5519)